MGASPHQKLQMHGIDAEQRVDLGEYRVQSPREGFQTLTLPQLGCRNLGIEESDAVTVHLLPGHGLFLEVSDGDE